jgi:hypothetical protein
MSDMVRNIVSAQEITAAALALRSEALDRPLSALQVIEVLERWGNSLTGPLFDAIPGVAFLKLWLRRGTLEPIVARELSPGAMQGGWSEERSARLRPFPVGVVGHWPAANVEIQPLLSLSCALLGGNACLVRIPTGLVTQSSLILEMLRKVDVDGTLLRRIFFATFDHDRTDLQRAMASAVDGAMIWGGAEAVTQIRSLPFPHWARIAIFGPRLSVAAMDARTWTHGEDRVTWCQRLARDVWQFDQQACSSPQALFLERGRDGSVAEFVDVLAEAFRTENRIHPRQAIEPALSSAICLSRASWLLADEARRAVFSQGPDWTILVGTGAQIPVPTQGRTLSVLMVDSLLEPIEKFDGMVQTLGLAISDNAREAALARAAGRHGVDRIVKLGRMHVFGSPWDGMDMIRPMVRLVRHIPSGD